MRRFVCLIGLAIVAVTLTTAIGCGSSPTQPGVPPVAVQTSFVISGNLSFTAAGQEAQLTATAGYSDGTTKNITASVTWTSHIETVAVVSPTGALRTTGLGATFIDVQNNQLPQSNQLAFKSLTVTVTPPGTLALFGWTRQPGSGPLPGVHVREPISGQSTDSNQNGDYALGGLTSAALVFAKAGYEDTQFETAAGSFDGWPLQEVVRIAAGESTSQTLAPHDVDYLAGPGTHCQPCRLIRLTSAAPGSVHLRVTWTEASSVLNVWVNGQTFPGSASHEIVADIPVGVGEILVYVGQLKSSSLGNYVPFKLETTR